MITPNGQSTTSPADQFTFIAPLPVVTGVSPASGTTDGGDSVTVTGTGFTAATAVDFGTTAASSVVVVSDTTITATSPALPPGTVDVTVTTAGGTSAAGPADQFTFATPPLAVTGVSPPTGSTLGGTSVTITGSDFIGATAVHFGSSLAAFLATSDTSITATSPAEAPGRVDITVTAATVNSTTSHADRFTFVLPPTVTAVSPRKGPVTGGTTVKVRGKGFANATAVTFGGVPATFTVNSNKSITATSPAAASGTIDVAVITPNGTNAISPTDQFTFATGPPSVTSISPATGTTLGGTKVTITGVNLTNAFAVNFGSTGAAIVVNSDTSITATSPPEKAGSVPVTVISHFGTSRKGSAPDTPSPRGSPHRW